MNSIPVLRWCLKTFHYYVIFTNSIFLILGLVLSFKLVDKTFFNILMTRLIHAWKEDQYNLLRDVVVVNLLEGTAAVLVPLFAYVAEVYTGRFKMVVVSTTVCIFGLMLASRAHGDDGQVDLRLFYTALGLLALAQAARKVSLRAFLEDQLSPMGLEDDQRIGRATFWWSVASTVAFIVSLIVPLMKFHFDHLLVVLIYVMGVFLFVFLLGIKHYNFVARIQNPFKDVRIVVLSAIANRNVECPQTQEPRISWLRWLDRAAEAGSCRAGQVRGVKLLMKMIPLWCFFLTFSVVYASKSTFFFAEAISLVGEHDDVTIVIFLSSMMRIAEATARVTSNFAIKTLGDKKNYSKQKMELVRIGIGMVWGGLCCVVAWETATRRQRYAMNVYWLTPQFLLLGLMVGCSQHGLQSFYKSQVSESLSTYGMPFGELAVGVGKFSSVLCIGVFSRRPFRWFQRYLKDSSLDKYYIFLAVLSVLTLVIYCLFARWYGGDAFLVEDDKMDSLEEQPDMDLPPHPNSQDAATQLKEPAVHHTSPTAPALNESATHTTHPTRTAPPRNLHG